DQAPGGRTGAGGPGERDRAGPGEDRVRAHAVGGRGAGREVPVGAGAPRGAAGHRERGAVPGQRPGVVDHRRGAGGRRRGDDQGRDLTRTVAPEAHSPEARAAATSPAAMRSRSSSGVTYGGITYSSLPKGRIHTPSSIAAFVAVRMSVGCSISMTPIAPSTRTSATPGSSRAGSRCVA